MFLQNPEFYKKSNAPLHKNGTDLTGVKAGRLLIKYLSIYKTKDGRPHWVCECDCGNLVIIRSQVLINGNTQSCGCLQKERCSAKNSRIPCDQRNLYYLWKKYAKNARYTNVDFLISIRDIEDICKKECFYCGTPPSNKLSDVRNYKDKNKFIYSGIDRIDSSKGYIHGNIVPCCIRCNKGKSNMNQNEFIAWANRLVEFQKIKIPIITNSNESLCADSISVFVNRIYRNYKLTGEKRGISFLIDRESFEDIIKKPCNYCGFFATNYIKTIKKIVKIFTILMA